MTSTRLHRCAHSSKRNATPFLVGLISPSFASGLEPFSEVDALVAGRYTYIATSTDVLKILDTDIVFLQSVDVDAYVVYSLTKCSPSVT